MKKHIIAAAGLAIALGLAGCSSSGSDTANGSAAEVEATPTETKATPTENIDKTWTFDYQGATGTFKLGDEDDETVKALEQTRASVDGKQYAFVPVSIDNTNGQTSLNMYGLTVITKDGQQLDTVSLIDVFSEWRNAAGDDTDKYNAIVDAENKYDGFDLQPGAKGTAIVTFAEPVTSAWRISVMPAGGFDQVEATAS